MDAERDAEDLRIAWGWMDSSPRWFRESLATWKETLDEFIEDAEREMIYGIYLEGEITAVIRFIPDKNQMFDLHLYAKRKTPFDVLLQGCRSIKAYLFDKGVKGLYGWINTRHRGVIRLYRELGFTDNGARETKGEAHGRPLEWMNFVSVNEKVIDLNA
jgi:hypothetical protein